MKILYIPVPEFGNHRFNEPFLFCPSFKCYNPKIFTIKLYNIF